MQLRKVACILALVCLAGGLATAVDFAALKPQGYVSDFAQVIDAASRAEIESYCAAVERSTGAQLAFVTIPSLDGEPVEDVANALYRKWGIGQKGTNEGVLLLLSVNDRRSRLEVGYGLEPIIPDGAAGGILRTMAPYLREGQYGPAMLEAAREIGGRIAQEKGVAIDSPAAQRRRPRQREQPIPIGLILGGIILFAVLSGMFGGGGGGGRHTRGGLGGVLPGLILGNMLGRSFGGRHSG
ncbi:MAG TPA: TPM domain-containing protein, partial [Bryobacteraceae bacterium]|nr:TPM domain-containing protein [Bryobacteraceae bacterium]